MPRVSAWPEACSGKAESEDFELLTRDPHGGVQVWREMIEGGHAIKQ
ncbi:MAG: hypothetical protein ACSLFF_10305 [Solirubrobacterales bacterium]